MAKPFVNSAEVAEMLGLPSRTSFTNRRAHMEDHLGFPEPMPHILNPMRWRREEVQAWINAQGKFRGLPDKFVPLRVAAS